MGEGAEAVVGGRLFMIALGEVEGDEGLSAHVGHLYLSML